MGGLGSSQKRNYVEQRIIFFLQFRSYTRIDQIKWLHLIMIFFGKYFFYYSGHHDIMCIKRIFFKKKTLKLNS